MKTQTVPSFKLAKIDWLSPEYAPDVIPPPVLSTHCFIDTVMIKLIPTSLLAANTQIIKSVIANYPAEPIQFFSMVNGYLLFIDHQHMNPILMELHACI